MLPENKIVGLLFGGVFVCIVLGVVNMVNPYFKEATHTEEEVKLMLKHQEIALENKILKQENFILEKDHERIRKSAKEGSVDIWSSSLRYRDSLRAVLNQP